MFFGVLHKRNATHLWNMLYFQALFWILAATFTELPSVVCLLFAISRNILHFAHCASSHRHWVLKISTVSLSRACLKYCLIGSCILQILGIWQVILDVFRFLLLKTFSIDVPIPASYVLPVSTQLAPANLRTCITLAYSYPSVRLFILLLIWGYSQGYSYSFRVITSSRAYRDLFQYITGWVSLLLFAARDVGDFCISDQNSYAMRRGRQPRGMQASPRPGGRDVQVTVTKTIEFDLELRPGSANRGLPGRGADEESIYPPLTEEEQQIRTLELQMKHDLEI
jgi:hypothetical protein